MPTVSIKQARTLYTTFEILHEEEACKTRYKHLAKALGGIKSYGRTTPIPITKLYEICGPWDLGWALDEACFRPVELAKKVSIYLANEIDGTDCFHDARRGIRQGDVMDLLSGPRQVAYFRRWFGQ